MPQTTTWWIKELSKYPPDTIVEFIGSTVCFSTPDGTHINPIREIESSTP